MGLLYFGTQYNEFQLHFRYEIDRLTALLHSRTGDLPFEEEEKRCEAMFSEPPDTFDRLRKNSNNPVQENETESHRLLEAVSTPVRVGKHVHSFIFFLLINGRLAKLFIA